MKINGTFLGGIANIFDYEKLKTTELISFNPPFSVQGPITLKEPLFSHCSVLVQDKVYVFERQFTNTSISISIHNGAIDYDYMPKMPQNIYNPSCASFYDVVNDRAGKNCARPNRAGSANFTEGSAGGSAESQATFWYFLVVNREYLLFIHVFHSFRKQYNYNFSPKRSI